MIWVPTHPIQTPLSFPSIVLLLLCFHELSELDNIKELECAYFHGFLVHGQATSTQTPLNNSTVKHYKLVTLGTIKVLSLVVFIHWSSINSNWGVSFPLILVTITQYIIRYKTKVSHKHMVVIYHRNTPLPKVRKGLDGYTREEKDVQRRSIFDGVRPCIKRHTESIVAENKTELIEENKCKVISEPFPTC
jgi:hypothetical protein